MRKVMIRNTLLMLLASAVFAGALMLYLRSAGSVVRGEATIPGTTYTSTAYGFGSDVVVSASYADGTLVALSADASGETPAIGGTAAEAVVQAILDAGSADGVDAVAGATLTSDAVLAAFADCEVQAGRLSEDEAAALTEGSTDATASATSAAITAIEDLTVTAGADIYTASAPGYASDVVVTLSYTDGVLTDVAIAADGETEAIGGTAASELADAILSASTASDVDAVAGATVTSNAALAAARYVEEAVLLSQADLYTASAKGYSSDVSVTAAYIDGVLIALTVDASGETAAVGGTVAPKVADEILAAGNADGVDIDAYAGSTITADAVLEAFADCEAQIGEAEVE